MPEVLRWPFRIILYVMLYIVWLFVSLLILAVLPDITFLEAFNLLPVGWITIAAVFFADLYFTQLKGKKNGEKASRPSQA